MFSILSRLVKSDIYDRENDIDYAKLETVIRQYDFTFLLDPAVQGIQVVARDIRRYGQVANLDKMNERMEVENNEDNSSRNKRKKMKEGQGGSEVFNMFTSQNKCVINEAFIDYMREQATTESTTDYYKQTNQGRQWHNSVEEDIQPHMDLYCKGNKSIFPKDAFLYTSKNKKVYIKIMYYVQRGLITPGEYGDQKYVNAYWGKIGGGSYF
jgi:hypothetical protein